MYPAFTLCFILFVAVMLQPFDYDPNEKNKHKFMVQTMFCGEGPIESQEQLVSEQKCKKNTSSV